LYFPDDKNQSLGAMIFHSLGGELVQLAGLRISLHLAIPALVLQLVEPSRAAPGASLAWPGIAKSCGNRQTSTR